MSEKKERGNIEHNNKKNKVELNYYLNKIVLKKRKLFKSEGLLDDIYSSLLKRLKKEPFFIIDKAIKNVMPIFLLKNKKIGKRVISTPFFILSEHHRKLLGLKWIIEEALSKPGKFKENFINETLDALDNKGSVKKKQKDLNIVVLNNRSNLRYRW